MANKSISQLAKIKINATIAFLIIKKIHLFDYLFKIHDITLFIFNFVNFE